MPPSREVAAVRPALLSHAKHNPSRLKIMDDQDALREKLETLKSEHRDLDDIIRRIAESGTFDPLQMQRLKKRKLVLKDLIAKVESRLLPDIIA